MKIDLSELERKLSYGINLTIKESTILIESTKGFIDDKIELQEQLNTAKKALTEIAEFDCSDDCYFTARDALAAIGGMMSKLEIEELKRFAKRRVAFDGDLSVKNVHNVPNLFPEMYKKMFHTESLRKDLFCTNSPKYSDADESVVEEYENWLRNEGSGDE